MSSTTIRGPHLEVDFSRWPVLVRCDGEVLDGVSSATVDIEAGELVMLTMRVFRFDLIGGSLPDLFGRGERSGPEAPMKD